MRQSVSSLGSLKAHYIHCSPLRLVPKRHMGDKWWLIFDLSFPALMSFNDDIPRKLCSLRYASVNDAAAQITHLGQSTQVVKMDLQDAY